jgi:hypothetical protein
MTSSSLDPALVVVVALAGLGVLAAFRSGARGAYRVARQTQEVTRMSGNLGRALGSGVVIVAVQWVVVSLTVDSPRLGRGLGRAGAVRWGVGGTDVLGHRTGPQSRDA